jgi:predicted ribosomally synthesized peptide with nif11-like leader
MSIQDFTAFLDANPTIAAEVASCATFDDVATIAQNNGFNLTGAELTKHAAEATAELSDEALEAVAGGSWTESSSGDATATTAAIGSAASVGSATIGATVALSIIVK